MSWNERTICKWNTWYRCICICACICLSHIFRLMHLKETAFMKWLVRSLFDLGAAVIAIPLNDVLLSNILSPLVKLVNEMKTAFGEFCGSWFVLRGYQCFMDLISLWVLVRRISEVHNISRQYSELELKFKHSISLSMYSFYVFALRTWCASALVNRTIVLKRISSGSYHAAKNLQTE